MNVHRVKSESARVKAVAASMLETASAYWWVWLVAGLAWLAVAFVVLQFDRSSATTIGIIAGILFLGGAIQSYGIGTKVEGAAWIWYLFAVLMLVGSAASLLYPGKTFLVMSVILGAVFVVTGVFWAMKAFALRDEDGYWWVWVVVGAFVLGLGIWLSGQFVTVRAVTLTAFTALWAAVRGVKDIAKALQLRRYWLKTSPDRSTTGPG